jgi:hypothetical protein
MVSQQLHQYIQKAISFDLKALNIKKPRHITLVSSTLA